MQKGVAYPLKKPWNRQALIEKFQAHTNEELARPMAAYMKNQFAFLGIQSPARKQLLKEYLAEHQLPAASELQEEVWALYQLPEREFQYAAIALLEKMAAHLSIEHLPFLQKLIEAKSWWDSVDAIAPSIAGSIVKGERQEGNTFMLEWAAAGNMWTNRAAILHQLKFKNETDTALLACIISYHAESPQFFHQKAIGWALREYAKTDPEWVRSYVAATPMKALSKREALKNIRK